MEKGGWAVKEREASRVGSCVDGSAFHCDGGDRERSREKRMGPSKQCLAVLELGCHLAIQVKISQRWVLCREISQR